MPHPFHRALWALLVSFAGVATPAQCDFQWQPGAPARGPLGTVEAMLELPNGDLVVGGQFTIADAMVVHHIARWDGTTWQQLGAGCGGPVRALARMPNGDLIAGGTFTSAGGAPAAYIARWDGTDWQPLGGGVDGPVDALLVLPNGDLVIAGSFAFAGGIYVRCIARWDGATYYAYDPSFPAWEVMSLALLPNGTLVAGCDVAANPALVQWNGINWQAVPGLDPVLYTLPKALTVMPNGDLLIGGRTPIAGVPHAAAIYNGTTMTPLDPPLQPVAVLAASNGEIVVAGATSGGSSVWAWNGTAWVTRDCSQLQTNVLLETTTVQVHAGGTPSAAADDAAVRRFTGTGWAALGAASPPVVRATARMANGDLVVGGAFAAFGGAAAANLARWNGSAWAPLGAGVDGGVWSLGAAPNGDLVVGGEFLTVGGAVANRVARWNGQVWTTLGSGLPSAPTAIAVAANGHVLANLAGNAGLWEFQGLSWSPVTLAVSALSVRRIVAMPNNEFALAGVFLGPQGLLGTVRYGSGTTTLMPLTGGGIAQDLLVDHNGDLVASMAGLRRWGIGGWTLLSPAVGQAIAELPDGTFVGGGHEILTGATTSCLFRYTASGAVPFGNVRGSALTLAASPAGDLIATGNLLTAGGLVSIGVVQAQPGCPAQVASVGAGCTGGAGPVTLVANGGPWTGAPFSLTASGMTANSLAVQIVGATPLAVPLPGGAPGCAVFVDPVFLDVFSPSGGTATTSWPVPNSVSFAGLALRAQVIGVEFGPLGIERLTGSNALQAVIGSL